MNPNMDPRALRKFLKHNGEGGKHHHEGEKHRHEGGKHHHGGHHGHYKWWKHGGVPPPGFGPDPF